MAHRVFAVSAAVTAVLVLTMPAGAHHSFSAVFDATKPVTVKGVLTEVRLENPHSWFGVEVKDAKGNVVKWMFEAATPTSLIRSGYKPGSLKVGDVVTVNGSRARDPKATMAAARDITSADGRTFIVGPKGEGDSGQY